MVRTVLCYDCHVFHAYHRIFLSSDGVLDVQAPGVHAAPSDLQLVANWMDEVSRLAQHLAIVDHVG